MIWALVENQKIETIPKTMGNCLLCNEQVFSKCGEVNVWHWAHLKTENCDSWYEPETFWHKHWKLTFGKENTEIIIKKNAKRHIADVYTNKKIVIELQNSLISKSVIREREAFYGEKMIWLINGEQFEKNLTIKDYWEDKDYHEMKSLPRNPIRWKRSTPEIKKGINGEFFKWKYSRKSWLNVQRHVFIDFGKDSLFWVKGGMGTSQIRGEFVLKEKFITKYGGNYNYYCQHQV